MLDANQTGRCKSPMPEGWADLLYLPQVRRLRLGRDLLPGSVQETLPHANRNLDQEIWMPAVPKLNDRQRLGKSGARKVLGSYHWPTSSWRCRLSFVSEIHPVLWACPSRPSAQSSRTPVKVPKVQGRHPKSTSGSQTWVGPAARRSHHRWITTFREGRKPDCSPIWRAVRF